MSWAGLLLLALGVVAVARGLRRANELFCLRVRGGEARVVRGRVPQRLLGDMRDVLRTAKGEAVIRVVVEDRAPRVEVEGELTAAERQRLRNTVSLWTTSQIRSAPRRR